MSTTTVETAILREFEELFTYLNERLFDNKLVMPVFRFDPKKRFGFRYQPEPHEFVVGSALRRLGWSDILVEFAHEMIHLCNRFDGISDHTANQYHNQEFADTALRVGFYTQRHPTRGWGILKLAPESGLRDGVDYQSPNEDDHEYLVRTFDRAALDLDVLTAAQREIRTEGAPKKQFQLKYICGCPAPHNSIRAGRRPDSKHPLRVTCDTCGKPFQLAPRVTEGQDDVI